MDGAVTMPHRELYEEKYGSPEMGKSVDYLYFQWMYK